MLLLDVNEEGLHKTRQLCLDAGASVVRTEIVDVTEATAVKRILETYDDTYLVDAVYPCAAVIDTPRRPLPDTVHVRLLMFIVYRVSPNYSP